MGSRSRRRERMDRLDEALTITRLMFTQDRPSFEGHYYRIDRCPQCAAAAPGPAARRSWSVAAASSARCGSRRGSRYTHWFALPLDQLQHKCEVLDQHCEMVGRDPTSIVRTVRARVGELTIDPAEARPAGTDSRGPVPAEIALPERAAEVLSEYMQAGAQGFVFRNPNLTTRSC